MSEEKKKRSPATHRGRKGKEKGAAEAEHALDREATIQKTQKGRWKCGDAKRCGSTSRTEASREKPPDVFDWLL